MNYNAVLAVFDNHPSPGHAYQLMALAGQLEGFEYDETGTDTKRLLVNLAAVNDEALINAVNNGSDTEVR